VLKFAHLKNSLTLLLEVVIIVTNLVDVVMELMIMNVVVVMNQDSYMKELVHSSVQMVLMPEKTHSQENVLLVTLIV
jgi:hypothetical protein